MRRRVIGPASAALVAALALAACSSGSSTTSPVPTNHVDLPASYRFAPTAITVTAGTTVTWTNDDHFTHSVEFLDGGMPTAPEVMKPGETATATFPTAGTYHYRCSFHPQDMQGMVVVSGG